MSFTKNDTNIRCPFFVRETAQSLICEGFEKKNGIADQISE